METQKSNSHTLITVHLELNATFPTNETKCLSSEKKGGKGEDESCKAFVDIHNLFPHPFLAWRNHSSSFPGMTQALFSTRYELLGTLSSTFFHTCPITKSLTSTGNYFLLHFFPLSTGKYAFRTGNDTHSFHTLFIYGYISFHS